MSDHRDSINFQEDGDPNGYVVVCKHIAAKDHPVLVVEMNPPYDLGHSGWEAICNSGDACVAEDYVHWPMQTFLEYEPSLKDLLKSPLGLPMIHRDSIASPWTIID